MKRKSSEKVKPQHRNKSEVLHVRLDDRMKFAIELIGRQHGQKLTKVIEAAITERAERLALGVHWTALWDADEGVRQLNLAAIPTYNSTADEQELRAFALHHKEFFYADPAATMAHRGYVSVLWPKLEQYLRTWRERRHENYWAAAEEMGADLKAAGVKPPAYSKAKRRGSEGAP